MGRPASAASRQALLDATAGLLDEVGAGGLTLAAVVKRSGVAKTTLYRQFGSLDGLIFALIAERVAADEPAETGSLHGDLEAVVRTYLARFDEPVGRELFVWMLNHAVASPEGAALFKQARFDTSGPTATVLQRWIERGALADDVDIERGLHLLQGTLISKRVISGDQLTENDIEAMVEMTVRALSDR